MVDITPLIRRDASVIQSYKDGQFKVSNTIYNHPIIVLPDMVLSWQGADINTLSMNCFDPLLTRSDDVDIILFGAGVRGCFVPPQIRQEMKQKGMTIDAMDTSAACRTYNVLMAEGRRVAAALLPFKGK